MATDGYGTQEIVEGLVFIQRGILNCNSIAVRGGAPALVDSGYATDVADTLERVRGAEIEPERIATLIGTHTHTDHIGGHKAIQERSGCRILMHRAGKRYIDAADGSGTWIHYFNYDLDYFRCDHGLEDGEVVPLGPYRFRVVHAPGHAADNIALYEPAQRLLIAGDTLLETAAPVVMLKLDGAGALDEVEASMDKLAALDVRLVLPGHGAPFTDAAAAIERVRRRVAQFRRDPQAMGRIILRSILMLKLVLLGPVSREDFLRHVLEAPWFSETVALHFGATDDAAMFDAVVAELKATGLAVEQPDGRLVCPADR